MTRHPARLNMGRRTLHRRLEQEGTTFRVLTEEVRHEVAVDLLGVLGVLGLTVQEAASRLGYSIAAASSRSFTRWTGNPPSTYRR